MEDLERTHYTNHADLALLKPSSWPNNGGWATTSITGIHKLLRPSI